MAEKHFEQQLFDWEGWDEHGPADLQFYNCTLKKDFHGFKAGHKFDWVYLSLKSSTLEFGYKNGNKIYKFNLILDTSTTTEIHDIV
jgi:hypothetical protein